MRVKLTTTLRNLGRDSQVGAPTELWVGRTKEALLKRIAAEQPVSRGFFSKIITAFDIFAPTHQLALASRVVGVFVVAAVAIVGGGTVSAQVFRDALPGAPLYGAKRLVERAQLFLSPNDSYRLRLQTDFTDRRADEVARLAESGDNASLSSLPIALSSFREQLAVLGEGLDHAQTTQTDDAASTARLLERKSAAYQEVLEHASAVISDPSLRAQLRQTIAFNDGVTLKAMALLVEKHLGGDTQAPHNVVVTNFEEHIKQAETQLDNAILAGVEGQADPATNRQPTKTKVLRARVAIEEAKTLVKHDSFQAALTKIAEAATLAQEVAQDATPDEEDEAAKAARAAKAAVEAGEVEKDVEKTEEVAPVPQQDAETTETKEAVEEKPTGDTPTAPVKTLPAPDVSGFPPSRE